MCWWTRAAVIVFILLSGLASPLDAQIIDQTRTAFAIVTPETDNSTGLVSVETLFNRSTVGLQQADITPSFLLTGAAFSVNLTGSVVNSTGIAIVNASTVVSTVHLSITDPNGIEILNQTLVVLPRAQLTRFLSELFDISPRISGLGLLTVTSDIPVALVALNFRGFEFDVVPVASLTAPFPLSPTLFIPTPIAGQGTVSPRTSARTSSGVVAGVGRPPVIVIGGPGSVLFPQVVSGGGWFTEISIANTSIFIQSVRIDLFNPDGTPLSSLAGIIIPPRGLVVFSTETGGIISTAR